MGRKARSRLPNEFVEMTGWERKHANKVLLGKRRPALHWLCAHEFTHHVALGVAEGGGEVTRLGEGEGDISGVGEAGDEKKEGEEWFHDVEKVLFANHSSPGTVVGTCLARVKQNSAAFSAANSASSGAVKTVRVDSIRFNLASRVGQGQNRFTLPFSQ